MTRVINSINIVQKIEMMYVSTIIDTIPFNNKSIWKLLDAKHSTEQCQIMT